VNFERWHHTYGCGKWFHAARCSITLEVFGTYLAQTLEPPKELLSIIIRKRPEWESF
jgi:sarcosine oxidase subunit delta